MLKNGENVILEYCGEVFEIFHRTNSRELFLRLTSDTLARRIPCFNVLIEEERQKQVKAYLQSCEVKWISKVNILNTVKNPTDDSEMLKVGAQLLFKTPELFESHESGYRLSAMALTSARCESLQSYLPDFQPVLFVRTHAEESIKISTDWIHTIEPRQHWKKKKRRPKIYRTPVLDYRKPSIVGRNLLDFNCAAIKLKKEKVRASIPYDDVLIAVVGADVRQLHELEKYSRTAGLVLVNSAKAGYEGTCLTGRHLAAVDDELIEQIQENAFAMASVFDEWRYGEKDEDAWAEQIVRKAKSSFGKPDSRYRNVTFDPIMLQNAVFLEVLCSFASFAVNRKWMTPEEAESWVAGATEVFQPKRKETPEGLRLEDPEVFIGFLKKWYHDPERKLVSLEENFSKKHEGAIREINGTLYLVLPEEWLSNIYLKETRKAKYDCGFADRHEWMQKIQRKWCEAGVLKQSGSSYRYRYDLMKNGSRDSTYVLAIPLEKIE